jgi:HK97 family phage prohead protease
MTPTSFDRGAVRFTVPLAEVKAAASGDKDGKGLIVKGHAAVFNRKSHDRGGFRTVIAPGAFDKVLDSNPDVHLVIDHDTRFTLARTTNKTLELRVDPYGLHMWANMAPTTYAKDLAILMERGDVDQMSFACDIGSDEWTIDENEEVTRTIFEASGLYDVTICAQGAFAQTDAQLVASFRDAGKDLASALEAGLVQGREVAAEGSGQEVIAQDADSAGEPGGEPVGDATVAASLAEFKAASAQRWELLKDSLPS